MKDREIWVDKLKGIAIILVVLGHAIRPEMQNDYKPLDVLFVAIYSVHMPLFFMISGYLFSVSITKMKTYGNYLKKKFLVYILPFVSYSATIYVAFKVFFYFFDSDLVDSEDIDSLRSYIHFVIGILEGKNPFLIHLWFLPALFVMVAFTASVYHVFGNNYFPICIMVAMILWALRVFFSVLSIHTITMIMWDYIFFAVGLKLDVLFKKKINWRALLALFVVSSTIVALYAWLIQYGNVSRYERKALMTVRLFTVLILCVVLADICKRIKHEKILKWIGMNSMSIYLFHQPFCCAFLGSIMYSKLNMPSIVVIVLEVILSIVILLFVVSVVSKNSLINGLLTKLFAVRYEELK